MIDIDLLYRRVQDLSRQYRSGFISNSEFNDGVSMAQKVVMGYYYSLYEESNVVSDVLSDFVKAEPITLLNGSGDIPSDFAFKIGGYVSSFVNKEPTIEQITEPITYVNSEHWGATLNSPIRKPRVDVENSYAMTRQNNKLLVRPMEVNEVTFIYIRKPLEAVRATNLDSTTDEENFDAINSVNLEWHEQCLQIFVDLLLYYKGLQIAASDIIDYAKTTNYVLQQNVKGN